MNKVIKAIFSILISGIMFCCGFLICKYQDFIKESDIPSEKIQEDNDFNILDENLKQEKIEENSEYQSQKSEEDDFILTNNEIAFLKEHLFGQWRFSELVFALDDSKNTNYNTTSNISSEGIEELKKTVVLSYEENIVWFPVSIGKNSLTDARDMFLFGAHGGFQWVQKPLYKMEEMATNNINLENIYVPEGLDVQMLGSEAFIKVTYYTQNEEEYTERKVSRNFADVIYINPNDKDTIYIDFCGLWKLKRDENSYSTGGKSDK